LRTFQTAIFGDSKNGADGNGDGDKLWSIPVLVLANKMDCGNAVPVHEIKEKLNPVAAKMSARESNVLGVSALKGYVLVLVPCLLNCLASFC
jgi:signal recognition particle receptor subunit beta